MRQLNELVADDRESEMVSLSSLNMVDMTLKEEIERQKTTLKFQVWYGIWYCYNEMM